MNIINKNILAGLLIILVLSACSSYIPVTYNPYKLAYAVLDNEGNPTELCFDTISPNNCIHANKEALKRYSLKKRLIIQQIILILGEPSQIDCKADAPAYCRVYFDHIHIDIIISPDERESLEKEIKELHI